ncbi:MAG TPA: cysteine hydrolase [Xanthobacteraceae bacterium]
MTSIEITDRSEMLAKLEQALALDPRQTAIVTIDMHRGHLDMAVATMPTTPEDARRVIESAREALAFARAQGIPVIHVVLTYRVIPGLGSESMSQPFWRAIAEIRDEQDRLTPGRSSTTTHHNIEGSRGTEIIPELFDSADYVVNNKKRLDCFYGTDLDMLLQNLAAKNVCLMGINTNTCVLNTSFTAFNKNYRVVVLSDCVASMYGADLHVLGLQNVARCLGWVIDNATFRCKIEEGRKRNAERQ